MAQTSLATRPFFIASQEENGQAYFEDTVSFAWHNGMSWQVRQRSSDAMKVAILEKLEKERAREGNILEVSTASRNHEIGVALSALNLTYINPNNRESHPVENWFQAAKVFSKDGITRGPYPELLEIRLAKRYVNPNPDKKTVAQLSEDPLFEKIQGDIHGAPLVCFCMDETRFPSFPHSAFYDYLYVNALNQDQNRDLAEAILSYRIFTDIMFNPGSGKHRRYNTQARSCAIYVSLRLAGSIHPGVDLEFNDFISAVRYAEANEPNPAETQMSLF